MAVSREPEFRTVRMREGYDLDAVDDFVDQVIDALDGRPGGKGITPERIEAEEFKVVRMREGYSMDDVDDWLDAAAAELRKKRHAAQQAQQQQYAVPAQHPQQYAQAPQAPHGAQTPDHTWAAADHVGLNTAPIAPVAPPAAPTPPVSPVPPAGQVPPAYPGAGGTGYTGYADPAIGGDPLTDSAVNELDPALRALDPSYGGERTQPHYTDPAGQQYAEAVQFQEPAQRTHQQPAVNGYEPTTDDPSLSDVRTPSTGLHHVEIWTRDIDAATRSFGWLFERLGWTLFQVWDSGRSWQSPGGGPYVVIEQSPDLSWTPYDRKAPGLNHLALAVPERWMVDRIVSEAPTYGWRLMFADRHPYAGGPHHYAAYFENEEGFEVEVATP
ncbi:DivIVA domain-containing protein [Phytoactinopolyspora halotolerans]|uniref:DivIVA domain-containing protein n=1 Tax=Phytoactinopolyspora halotolerans TaxID=1981512 RepID=A0A6L9SF21_9ACTN|nr:DivIVA domain-containing protein [Phytoactinopolyspora halotolerans]NEE03689.1 DivIVA domain-containing protein [Phytoactinopolyspora halotolerans]